MTNIMTVRIFGGYSDELKLDAISKNGGQNGHVKKLFLISGKNYQKSLIKGFESD